MEASLLGISQVVFAALALGASGCGNTLVLSSTDGWELQEQGERSGLAPRSISGGRGRGWYRGRWLEERVFRIWIRTVWVGDAPMVRWRCNTGLMAVCGDEERGLDVVFGVEWESLRWYAG